MHIFCEVSVSDGMRSLDNLVTSPKIWDMMGRASVNIFLSPLPFGRTRKHEIIHKATGKSPVRTPKLIYSKEVMNDRSNATPDESFCIRLHMPANFYLK